MNFCLSCFVGSRRRSQAPGKLASDVNFTSNLKHTAPPIPSVLQFEDAEKSAHSTRSDQNQYSNNPVGVPLINSTLASKDVNTILPLNGDGQESLGPDRIAYDERLGAGIKRDDSIRQQHDHHSPLPHEGVGKNRSPSFSNHCIAPSPEATLQKMISGLSQTSVMTASFSNLSGQTERCFDQMWLKSSLKRGSFECCSTGSSLMRRSTHQLDQKVSFSEYVKKFSDVGLVSTEVLLEGVGIVRRLAKPSTHPSSRSSITSPASTQRSNENLSSDLSKVSDSKLRAIVKGPASACKPQPDPKDSKIKRSSIIMDMIRSRSQGSTSGVGQQYQRSWGLSPRYSPSVSSPRPSVGPTPSATSSIAPSMRTVPMNGPIDRASLRGK